MSIETEQSGCNIELFDVIRSDTPDVDGNAANNLAPEHVRSEVPVSLGAQARAIEWAIQQHTGHDPTETVHGYSQALMATSLGPMEKIRELPPHPKSRQIVFKDAGHLVVGPQVESPTLGEVELLTVGDIRTLQASEDLVATVPKEHVKHGRGAEILDLLPIDERELAIESLRAVAEAPPRNVIVDGMELFTHLQPDSNSAAAYFADEADLILRSAGYELHQ